MLTIGATLAAFSMEEFLVPNSIFDGGVAGVAMISEHYLPIPLGVLVAFMNLPFLIVAYNKLGHGFVIKAGYSMLLFSILLVVFRNMAEATEDLLLATVFGGALLGVGVGLVLRGGGCLDGTEIVGILVSRRSDLSIGKIVLTTNTPGRESTFRLRSIVLSTIQTLRIHQKTFNFPYFILQHPSLHLRLLSQPLYPHHRRFLHHIHLRLLTFCYILLRLFP